MQERRGTWGAAKAIPGLAALNKGSNTTGFLGLPGNPVISCGAAGSCAIAGGYLDGSDLFRGFIDSESGGRWRDAQEVPGTGGNAGGTVANTVSCAAGTCSVTGVTSAGPGNDQAFTLDETESRWGAAQAMPGTGTQSEGFGVTCMSTGYCAVGGDNNAQAFIAVKPLSATATSLTLSTAKVMYGHEETVKIRINVTSPAGTPGGRVTLKAGKTRIANLTLKSGKAAYRLAATKLRVGTYKLTADYGGKLAYSRSASLSSTLTVRK